MSPVTIRNYLSDLRQFIAWCEGSWQEGQNGDHPFGLSEEVEEVKYCGACVGYIGYPFQKVLYR